MAAPFVQGLLTGERRTAEITSRCACCERSIQLSASGDLGTVHERYGQEILVFTPAVDWSRLAAPTIVPDY